MKYTIKHPLVADAKSPRGKTFQKTVMTAVSTFDIPILQAGDHIRPAVSYQNITGRNDRHAVTVMEDNYGRHYIPATLPDSSPVSAMNRDAVGQYVASHLSDRIDRIKARLDSKLVVPELGGKPIREADYMAQPDIASLPDDRIDHDALRAETDAVAEAVSDLVFVGRTLYTRTLEPYYVVTSDGPTNVSLNILFSPDLPSDMIACFRLGHLDKAQEFARKIASLENKGDPRGTPGLAEHEPGPSDMNDLDLTAAVATWRAFRSFVNSFNPEYRAHQVVDQLIRRVPLEELSIARRIEKISESKSHRMVAEDPEPLWGIIEEIVELGPESTYAKRRLHLEAILDLWHNQEINLDIVRSPVP